MKLFGGIMPFIGFRSFIAEDENNEIVLVRAFEFEWFGTIFSIMYRLEYLDDTNNYT